MKYILSLLLAFCSFTLFPAVSKAELRVDMTKGVVEPMPIAITPFYDASAGASGGTSKLSNDILGVISANLESSGLFKIVNPAAFIQTGEALQKNGPNFGEWRASGAQALVTGQITPGANGSLSIEVRLWDLFSQEQLLGKRHNASPQAWRRMAHIVSDEVYERLTGEQGYFDSRIVYVAESGPVTNRVKRLAIMDQDGANQKYLTDGRSLVLTPRFSPTQQQITYMSYLSGKPTVYLYDISTGRHEPLGHFPGMTFAPRFSPDGKKVVMSMARNRSTDIYEMSLSSRTPKQITRTSSIDTAPSYSPDGSQIVFESDRGGTQQLYVMNSDGSNVQRITFNKGRYASPVWSPRGDLIAFTRMYEGKFYIGVIRPDGKGERLITSAYHVEGPTWSPNGRVLSYFKEQGSGGNGRTSNLYTVDITGYNERVLRTPTGASDPAWSPLN